jgi:Ca2+-binding RTX toxin-like protein
MSPAPRLHVRPAVEVLEDRAVPAVTATLSGGVLSILGTSGNDSIIVRQINNVLSIDGIKIQTGATSVASVPVGQVLKIQVHGGDGNDSIHLNSQNNPSQQGITIPTEIWGDAGDDTIWGSAGPCTIHGGPGNDVLYSGPANNVLYADQGNDSLVAGAGNDTLVGGTGNDTLVGIPGHDVLTGGSGFMTYHESFNLAAPFYQGESISDIRQNQSPTCQTLAAIVAGIRAGVDFSKQITYIGGTSYVVSVMKGNQLTHQIVQFDGTWNDNDPQPAVDAQGRTLPEFWTILLQRARLQSLGVDTSHPLTAAQWQQADVNSGYLLFSVGNAIYSLTGQRTRMYYAQNVTPQQLQATLANPNGMAVGATFADASKLAAGTGLWANHAYTILKVYQQGSNWMVQLYNPAGIDGSGPPRDGMNDGYLTVTWAEFSTSFQYLNLV